MEIYRPKLKKQLDGVFYWISPGQVWITDSLFVGCESEGQTYQFVPWSKFADPFDDFEFNEALNDIFKYRVIGACSGCMHVRQQVTAAEFDLRNDTVQPLIHGVGTAFIHTNAKRILEVAGFKGFCFVPNSKKQAKISLLSDYWFIETYSSTSRVAGVVRNGENTCPNCEVVLSACTVCGEFRNRCPNCKSVTVHKEVNSVDIHGNTTNGSEWPLMLSTWNLDDVVGGAYWLAVTGEIVEFMINNDITPFAFGPIALECDGASDEQLERALQVRRDISFQIR
jgi:hypothetical protein